MSSVGLKGFFAASVFVANLYSFEAYGDNFIELSRRKRDFIGMKMISEITAYFATARVTCFPSCFEALVNLSEELSTEPADLLD